MWRNLGLAVLFSLVLAGCDKITSTPSPEAEDQPLSNVTACNVVLGMDAEQLGQMWGGLDRSSSLTGNQWVFFNVGDLVYVRLTADPREPDDYHVMEIITHQIEINGVPTIRAGDTRQKVSERLLGGDELETNKYKLDHGTLVLRWKGEVIDDMLIRP